MESRCVQQLSATLAAVGDDHWLARDDESDSSTAEGLIVSLSSAAGHSVSQDSGFQSASLSSAGSRPSPSAV
jgi:hypothetical protein